MTNVCASCGTSGLDGMRSKRAGLLCAFCLESLGMLPLRSVPCGQSCSGKKLKNTNVKAMSELEKGDIIPACGHCVRVRILRFLRNELNSAIFLVRSFDYPKRTPFERRFYGPSNTLVHVERK